MTSIDLNSASHDVCSLVSALKNIRTIETYAQNLRDKIARNLDEAAIPFARDREMTIDLGDCDALNDELRSIRVDLARAMRFFEH